MASSSKTTYKEAEGETRDWLALPTNVTAIILQKLDTFDLVTTACLVCPEWFDIWKDPLTWRTIRITKYGNSPSDLAENVCRYAIDGSCGQAEDISITNFGSDDLLKYIGDRARHLRHLQLENFLSISGVGLFRLSMKLYLLEELDLSAFNSYVPREVFEFGICSRHLKILKFNYSYLKWDTFTNLVLAVATTMPNLRHLQISGLPAIEEQNVLAILDGSPLLQCLDLSRCISSVHMGSSLDNRCRAQMKD